MSLMDQYEEDNSPTRLRRKDIRKDKFRREKENPFLEKKRVQRVLKNKERDRNGKESFPQDPTEA